MKFLIINFLAEFTLERFTLQMNCIKMSIQFTFLGRRIITQVTWILFRGDMSMIYMFFDIVRKVVFLRKISSGNGNSVFRKP